MSRVMAMWMIEGLWEFLSREDHVVSGHSLPFRNAGASRNSGRLPEEDDVDSAGKTTVPAAARKIQRRWSMDGIVEFWRNWDWDKRATKHY